MKVEITEEGIVLCDSLTCDPLGNWITNDHCGNCPIIHVCEDFLELALKPYL